MRCFSRDHEATAFVNTLRDPHLGDKAATNRDWSINSKWMLNLTPSFWLLMVLAPRLSVRSTRMTPKPFMKCNREWTSEEIASVSAPLLQEKSAGKSTKAAKWLKRRPSSEFFGHLLWNADILCTTPAISMQEPYSNWKMMRTRGIAVDEAGSISRPDLYRVWGNTMLPCLLGGDDKQLPPAVMTVNDKDIEGYHTNRLAPDAQLSALEFFRASGWPIYREM
ncbi:hypothetical protein THARTR1_07603 [Trichoderma harzianum]|uniref:DNA2/NAM7 helicase helicase domain-containing protein n=1 Tax=Trichoderma harzianum TaxID=5544 RepID=A0A2K0U236_TRIHA|nr:hypothetical protein THARTR1_07603 [Trichoderma harzianum]